MMTELPFDELQRQMAPGLAERCARLFGQKRPDRYSPIVIEDAAENFGGRIVEWSEGSIELPRAIADLTQIGADGNGYEKTSRLERLGYHPDSELVSLMDEFDDAITLATERAVKAWVRETEVALLYRAGDNIVVRDVEFRAGQPARRRELTGTIIREEPLSARYVVRVPDLGHVAGGPGAIGIIVNHEDVLRRAKSA